MASQPAASFDSVEFNSFIRGYHPYKDIWEPFVGETLLLKREPTNVKDGSAVAVMKETEVVGHVPYNISSGLSMFLRRDCSRCRLWDGSAMHLQVVWANHLHSTTSTNHTVATRERTFVIQAREFL